MITEDYVSFETAKLLKEKGFQAKCTACYRNDHTFELVSGRINYCNPRFSKYKMIPPYNAPTIQMAMKWLREVYKIHVSVEMGFDVDNRQYFFFAPLICKFSSKTGEYQTPFGEMEFNTYEEAAEAAIKYCLENLI